jgi:signal transduction histidine kinase
MRGIFRFFATQSERGRLLCRTVIISAAIVAVAVFCDFAFNVLLFHAVTNYTPWSTLAIVVLVAPPSVFILLLQTERVRTAQSLLASEQAARAAAEAINRTQSRFLANTSHELRTPLNGVIGYAELLLESAQEEGRAQEGADLQRIIASAKRLLRLVNDLLDLAKLDADRIEIRPAPFNVADMLREVIEIVTPMAAKNRSKIALTIADGVVMADSDGFRLSQCVLNLLSNAAKFTTEGTIAVRAWSELRTDRDWLLIEVRDTGVGIPPEQQPFLFEPFMQARSELERVHEGTGLGLAITRKLARLMGGDVELKSELRKGSTFAIRIPMYLVGDDGAAPKTFSARASIAA